MEWKSLEKLIFGFHTLSGVREMPGHVQFAGRKTKLCKQRLKYPTVSSRMMETLAESANAAAANQAGQSIRVRLVVAWYRVMSLRSGWKVEKALVLVWMDERRFAPL